VRGKGKNVQNANELNVYKMGFESAMRIFEITKDFPKEEKYSMTDQIRRSSRSVCANLSEGWQKRRYRLVFVNKLSDAAQEATETLTWLEFALACNYISKEIHDDLARIYKQIIAMLLTMESKSHSFCKL
jgi:four helix bundle protein